MVDATRGVGGQDPSAGIVSAPDGPVADEAPNGSQSAVFGLQGQTPKIQRGSWQLDASRDFFLGLSVAPNVRPRYVSGPVLLGAKPLAAPIALDTADAQEEPAKPPLAGRDANGAQDTRKAELSVNLVVDAGVTHAEHTEPTSAHFGPGRETQAFGAQNMRGSGTYVSENGVQQSLAGFDLKVPVGPAQKGISLIAKGETYFMPLSLRLTDGPASLVQANGVPVSRQDARGDSGVAGQPLNGQAYFGVNDSQWGLTATWGRQRSLAGVVDGQYDPASGSYMNSENAYAASTSGGIGTTPAAFWDKSLKINEKRGPLDMSLMYAPGGQNDAIHGHGFAASAGGTGELKLGGKPWGTVSGTIAYTAIDGAVGEAPLTAGVPAGFPSNSLAGTVSNNRAVSLGASYKVGLGGNGTLTTFAGFQYAGIGPSGTQVAPGSTTVGGVYSGHGDGGQPQGQPDGMGRRELRYRSLEVHRSRL